MESQLPGTWKVINTNPAGPCLPFTGNPNIAALSSSMTFTSTGYTSTVTFYSDSSCTTAVATSADQATYTVGSEVSTNYPGYQIDITTTTATLTPLDASTASAFNSSSFCGVNSGWSANVAQDVLNKTCALTSSSTISWTTPRYDIFSVAKLNGQTVLYNGLISTGAGTSNATRPTQFDLNFWYTKQ